MRKKLNIVCLSFLFISICCLPLCSAAQEKKSKQGGMRFEEAQENLISGVSLKDGSLYLSVYADPEEKRFFGDPLADLSISCADPKQIISGFPLGEGEFRFDNFEECRGAWIVATKSLTTIPRFDPKDGLSAELESRSNSSAKKK